MIEYVEGVAQCEECGSALLPGSPPELPAAIDLTKERNVKLVPVRIFAGGTAQMDAELARNILQTQRIPSMVQARARRNCFPCSTSHCSSAKVTKPRRSASWPSISIGRTRR